MTTIEAMKQAQHLLRWTHFGECRTYPGPVPEAREVDKLLREAIATEEAQGVEAVARVKRLTNCSIIDSTGCAVSWEDLPDGSALFTRPAPSPADHIGDTTKLVGERAALIAKLRDIPPNPFRLMMWEAADMLAADAQEVERKYISPVRTIADLVNNLLLMDQALPIYGAQYIDHPTRGRCAIAVSPTVSRERVQDSRWIGQGNELNAAIVWTRAAQQVAVPQGWKLVPESPTLEMMSQMPASCNSGEWCEYYSAMLAAAPQPPHGACDSPELCKLNGECAGQYGTKQKCTDSPTPPRAERVPMTPDQISDTYQKATGQHLRPCDKHAVESMTREIEAHHKIGVKQ